MFETKLPDSRFYWAATNKKHEHNKHYQDWIEPRAEFAMVHFIAEFEIKTTGSKILTFTLLTATGFDVGIKGDVTILGEIVCFHKGQLISKADLKVLI